MLVGTRVGTRRAQVPFALHLVCDEPLWASLHASQTAEHPRVYENLDTLDLSVSGRAAPRFGISLPIVRVDKADRGPVGLVDSFAALVRETPLLANTAERYYG